MIDIDKTKCNGCPGRDIPFCEQVCPGSLPLRGEDGKAYLRDQSACWNCCSCVKNCPQAALAIVLPFQISEVQLRLSARCRANSTTFTLKNRSNQIVETYEVEAKQGASRDDGTGDFRQSV